jgi:hypothetical protein
MKIYKRFCSTLERSIGYLSEPQCFQKELHRKAQYQHFSPISCVVKQSDRNKSNCNILYTMRAFPPMSCFVKITFIFMSSGT